MAIRPTLKAPFGILLTADYNLLLPEDGADSFDSYHSQLEPPLPYAVEEMLAQQPRN